MGWEHNRIAEYWNQFHGGVVALTLALATVLTVYSFVVYIYRYRGLFQQREATQLSPGPAGPRWPSAAHEESSGIGPPRSRVAPGQGPPALVLSPAMFSLELITIGTELLLGFTVDTNSAELGQSLAAAGVRVVRRTSVSDETGAIAEAVASALTRTGAVLTTGGLGPTADDVTKRVVADLFGMPLDFDQSIWNSLLERFARMGRVPAPANRSQAEVPQGATVLPNRWGTAPGLWLEGPVGLAILLPGVPSEMRNLLQHEVLPRLASRGAGTVIRSRTVRTTGIPESALAERLGDIESRIAPLSLAYLPGTAGVDLRATAWGMKAGEADGALLHAAGSLRQLAGEYVYGEESDDLAAVVLARARERGLTLATAESCTGGLVGGRLTDIPGSSEVYLGGVVAYHNSAKLASLDVPPALLADHGAVSEAVAGAMAVGVVGRFGADLGLSITGIAGPAGGTAEKPVGTVWFGMFVKGELTTSRAIFPGNRKEIRERATQSGLYRIWRALG